MSPAQLSLASTAWAYQFALSGGFSSQLLALSSLLLRQVLSLLSFGGSLPLHLPILPNQPQAGYNLVISLLLPLFLC